MGDTGKWGFLILLALIVGPFVFWIVSLFIAWIKWLFFEKEALNKSYATMKDFRKPISKVSKINYELGIDSEVKLSLLDENYKEIKLLFDDSVSKGRHFYEFDSTPFKNGVYFCELVTENQKTTKRFMIINQ